MHKLMEHAHAHIDTRARMRLTALLLFSAVSVLGCGSDTTGPAVLSESQLYWALRLNYHAINMATRTPYDTVRLHASARSATGTLLDPTNAVTYTTSDSTLSITPDGLMTAHYATNGQTSVVIASLQMKNVTRADTVFVQVTDTVPQHPLTVFSIQPRTGGLDSAKIAVNNSEVIPLHAVDAVGDTVCGVGSCALVVAWSSSDNAIAFINLQGYLDTRTTGHITLYGETLFYGTLWRDSLPFVIGYPINAGTNRIFIGARTPTGSSHSTLFFETPALTIGVGGTVIFQNFSQDSVDVVFDDSTAVAGAFGGPGGNIPLFAADTLIGSTSIYRRFHIAGRYPYHSKKYGTGGVITVSSGP